MVAGRPALVLFDDFSAFTSRCGLHTRAVHQFGGHANRGFSPLRSSMTSPYCFRLERLAGGAVAPTESAAFARLHTHSDIGPCPTIPMAGIHSGLDLPSLRREIVADSLVLPGAVKSNCSINLMDRLIL